MHLFALMLENDSRGKAGEQLKKIKNKKKSLKLWGFGMRESNKPMEGAGWEKRKHACGSGAGDYRFAARSEHQLNER